jgi:hypothetical protein
VLGNLHAVFDDERKLRMHEGDRSLIVAQLATQEELLQAQAEGLPMGEPPADGLALGLDAVTSRKLNQRRLPMGTLLGASGIYVRVQTRN